jgi:hypothetical protein
MSFLARGWVPPYTGTETPQPSGEEPTSGEEPPKVGEMTPGRDSGQQTVILEPGECAPTSDEHQSDRNYGIDFPSDHEGHDCLQNLPGQQTAAMRKEFPNWWPRNPYDHEQDHTPMPTSPGVAPMTPPSPLYQTQETTLDTRQEAQIIEGIKQLRKDAVPNPKLSPMLSPVGHENANEDPQVDDHNKEAQDIIDPTPIPEDKPRRKLTKIIYDRSPTKTPKRHGGRMSQPRSKSTLRTDWGRAPQKSFLKKN